MRIVKIIETNMRKCVNDLYFVAAAKRKIVPALNDCRVARPLHVVRDRNIVASLVTNVVQWTALSKRVFSNG